VSVYELFERPSYCAAQMGKSWYPFGMCACKAKQSKSVYPSNISYTHTAINKLDLEDYVQCYLCTMVQHNTET